MTRRADRLTESYWPADHSMPVHEVTVGGLLRQTTAEKPDAVAVVSDHAEQADRKRWTYAELLDISERAAGLILERFEPGERVAVWAPTSPEWVFLEFGAALAGVTIVTVNPAYRASELKYVLAQSRAAGIFLRSEYRTNPMAKWLEEVAPDLPDLRETVVLDDWDELMRGVSAPSTFPDVTPDDPAQIQYTSGTTGFPKGATLHHRGLCNVALYTAVGMGLDEHSVWVNPLPMFHTGGCALATLGPVWFGATHVPVTRFDPNLVLELLEAERGTHTAGVPTMMLAMLEHESFARRDLSSMRCIQVGGSAVPPELVRRMESEFGAQISIGYGQTETSPEITQTALDDTPEDKAYTIGCPLPQQELKIVDTSTGETVPVGATGEICVRGYQVMLGYFDMPEQTAATIDADGWLHTGDLASMDERGYLTFQGRIKEMIIRGGENMFPREIEEAIAEHPAVSQAAVVGIPDPKWGEVIAAFVLLVPGQKATAQELRSFVREHLAPHKTPEHWSFVEEFPLTPSGKIQKVVLREHLIDDLAGQSS